MFHTITGNHTCKTNSAGESSSTGNSKVFKYKCTYSATITDTLKRRGWVEVEDFADDWDIFFCDMNQFRDVFPNRALGDHQKIAHFRNCFEISRKNLMVKNLKRLRYRIEKAFGRTEAEKCNFYPTTFVLPTEQPLFLNEFRNSPGSLWIVKPAAGAQGRGIFIFQKLKDYFDWRGRVELPESVPTFSQPQMSRDNPGITQDSVDKDSIINDLNMGNRNELPPNASTSYPIDDSSISSPNATTSTDSFSIEPSSAQSSRSGGIWVVQRYVMNPYLIGGKKFDIRFYVLVTSYSPLRAWVYREGFARFSAGQFSLKSLQDIYVHLTNVAIQRTSEDYNAEKGSKWSLRYLREYLTSCHGKDVVLNLVNSIDNIIIRTLQSVQHQIIHDPHCFEIYGFDVLIDDNVRPWLLETNASPSFSPSNEEDYRLKCAIIDDTVHVLDLEKRLTGFEKRIGGYDLIWNDGPVYANPEDCCHANGSENGAKLNSFLGCLNDRAQQLRELFANAKFIREIHKVHIGGTSSSESSIGGDISTEKKFSGLQNGQIKDDRFRYPGEPVSTSSDSHNFNNYNSNGNSVKKIAKPKLPSANNNNDPGFIITGKPVLIKRNIVDYIKYLDKNKYTNVKL